MAPDDNGFRLERDNRLVSQFVQRVIDCRRDYYEWIQEEVNESLTRIWCIEAASSGAIKRQAQRVDDRLQSINSQELVEITNNIKRRCDEIMDGAWDDRNPMDAYQYLEEGLSYYKNIVRELIQLRKTLDGFVDEDSG